MLQNIKHTNSDAHNNQCVAGASNPSAVRDARAKAADPGEPSTVGDAPSGKKTETGHSFATADGHSNPAANEKVSAEGNDGTRNQPPKSGTSGPEVEVLDVGPRQTWDIDYGHSPRPVWKNPEYIAPLLESGDERDVFLVERFIHREDEMFDHLRRAVQTRYAEVALLEYRSAANVGRSLIKTAENLAEHRYGGVQNMTVLELSAPTIGSGDKIQRLKQPKPGTAEARLVERLHHIERAFEDAASTLDGKVRSTLDDIIEHGTAGRPSGRLGDYERWENFRAEAQKFMDSFSTSINKLERGHRQVVITKREKLNTDRKSVRDQDLRCDTESSGEGAKSRPREPVAN